MHFLLPQSKLTTGVKFISYTAVHKVSQIINRFIKTVYKVVKKVKIISIITSCRAFTCHSLSTQCCCCFYLSQVYEYFYTTDYKNVGVKTCTLCRSSLFKLPHPYFIYREDHAHYLRSTSLYNPVHLEMSLISLTWILYYVHLLSH